MSEVSSVERALTVEIPEEDVKKEFMRAYADLRKRIHVPGFRLGKAPRSLLERRYAGVVAEDVALKLIPDYSRRAVKEAGITPITVVLPSIDYASIAQDKAFSFTTTVEVEPEITVRGATGIPLRKQTLTVTTEDEEKALDSLRYRQAELHTVAEDRDTIEGDFVSVDIQAFVDKRLVDTLTKTAALLRIGSKSSYVGVSLDHHLTTRRKGDVVDVAGIYPDDPPRTDMSGKPLTLSIHIREIKKAILPDLNDELASGLGVTSLDELRVKVREGLEAQLQRDTETLYKDQLIAHLVDTHTFDIPPSLLQEEMALAMQHIEHDHRSDHGDDGYDEARGPDGTDQAGDDPKRREKLRTGIQEVAARQVKARLILNAIAKEQGLTFSEDEVESEYTRLAEQMKISVADMKRKVCAGGDRAVQRLKSRLLHRKAIHYVYTHACIQD